METIVVKPGNEEQLKVVKAILKALSVDFVSKKEKVYNEGFVEKIETSRRQAKEGKVTVVDPKNLWK